MLSPSSKNAQPWRIHVVTARRLLDSIAHAVTEAGGSAEFVPADPRTGQPRDDYDSTVRESADVLRSCPCGLFVENRGDFSVDRATMATAPADQRESAMTGYGLEMIGLGGAILAMWLTAVDLGLAGVFIGDVLIAAEAIEGELGCRGDLVGVLALGAAEAPPHGSRSVAASSDRVVWHRA